MTELEKEIFWKLLIDLFLANPRRKQQTNEPQNPLPVESDVQTICNHSSDSSENPSAYSSNNQHELKCAQVDLKSLDNTNPRLERTMKTVSAISELPNVPAVYALYGGQGKGTYVAYVGLARQLKTRIIQHLVRHDSSVTTGVQAVSLNPDYITKVGWGEHNDFADSSKLTAAEPVAFNVLDPALRSRGTIPEEAKHHYHDESFINKMQALFRGEASGCFIVPTLQGAFERILTLENSTIELERRIYELEQKFRDR